MIKAVIFDFDGVILESADIKTEAFRELFSKYPEKIEKIVEYHLLNAGISRYVKFRYFYENILGRSLSKEKELKLGDAFSKIVLEKVLSAPFVKGALEFLTEPNFCYNFFIASGTPEEELHSILRERNIDKCFKEAHGSPKTKPDVINDILHRYNLVNSEAVYVGDAESDRKAAEETRVFFIERKADLKSRVEERDDCFKIKDLSNLRETLEKIKPPSPLLQRGKRRGGGQRVRKK
ncbi:MAG: HAD hydrolase-like protein [Candidatus Omnitrophota bacterium]